MAKVAITVGAIRTHKDGTAPTGKEVFVFGSNLGGIHGGGAAKAAKEKFGAVWGKGIGRMGQSYAIPTKDEDIETLPMKEVKKYVRAFVKYATENPSTKFFVTRIGCVLAGYSDEEMAPLFKPALPNCSYAESWKQYL